MVISNIESLTSLDYLRPYFKEEGGDGKGGVGVRREKKGREGKEGEGREEERKG